MIFFRIVHILLLVFTECWRSLLLGMLEERWRRRYTKEALGIHASQCPDWLSAGAALCDFSAELCVCVCLNVCIHSQVSLSAPAPYSFFHEHTLSICYVQSLVLVAVVWELIRTETLHSGYISLSTALHVLFVTVYLYHKKC